MDELEKLFAEASASVKKATARKEPESPAEEPAPAAPTPTAAAPPPPPPPQAAPPVAAAPATSAPAAPAAAPRPAAPGGFTVVSAGTQNDASLTLEVDGAPRDLPWGACQLALGRVGTVQALGVKHGAAVYMIPQDRVNFKGLVRQLQPDTVGNWRRLIVELAEKIPSSDPGIAAIVGGGGMIPKYATVEAFADQVRATGA